MSQELFPSTPHPGETKVDYTRRMWTIMPENWYPPLSLSKSNNGPPLSHPENPQLFRQYQLTRTFEKAYNTYTKSQGGRKRKTHRKSYRRKSYRRKSHRRR